MATEGYNPTDLASVLRTLSALSNNQSYPQNPSTSIHQSQGESQSQTSHLPQIEEEDDDPYEPAEPEAQTSPPFPVTQTPQARPRAASNPADSSTITTWPAALRHVMHAVSQNEDSQRRIRRLIQSQHEHERQWWRGREALLRKQKARVEKKKELDAVLRSVGAPFDDTKLVSTAEEDQAELGNYDVKVYKASRQMADAMALELRALRIPFFTIREYLVSDISTPPREDASKRQLNHDSGSVQQTLLTKDELSVLRRRMLELLQDLCKE